MEAYDRNLIIELAGRDFELRRLYDEHQLLEDRLSTYENSGFLTADEEMERNRLKKIKLQGVDQMMQILTRYRCGTEIGEAASVQ